MWLQWIPSNIFVSLFCILFTIYAKEFIKPLNWDFGQSQKNGKEAFEASIETKKKEVQQKVSIFRWSALHLCFWFETYFWRLGVFCGWTFRFLILALFCALLSLQWVPFFILLPIPTVFSFCFRFLEQSPLMFIVRAIYTCFPVVILVAQFDAPQKKKKIQWLFLHNSPIFMFLFFSLTSKSTR